MSGDGGGHDGAGGLEVVGRPLPLGSLYARSLLARPGGLDGTSLVLPAAELDRARAAALARLTGAPVRDEVPLTFPHLLAFGLQVQLMVTRPFPFRLLGLVHLRQSITSHRPLRGGERPRVVVRAERLVPHAKGAVVDLVADLDVDGEPVWSGRSSYLARGASAPALRSGRESLSVVGGGGGRGVDEDELLARAASGVGPRAVWPVPADTGRRYAAVSGDVNPIHLHPWSARALGFPRAIAHGMWTTARVAAHLGRAVGPGSVLEVEFRRPVLLPSTVACTSVRRDDAPGGGWDVAVTDRAGSRVHLLGSVRPAPAPAPAPA